MGNTRVREDTSIHYIVQTNTVTHDEENSLNETDDFFHVSALIGFRRHEPCDYYTLPVMLLQWNVCSRCSWRREWSTIPSISLRSKEKKVDHIRYCLWVRAVAFAGFETTKGARASPGMKWGKRSRLDVRDALRVITPGKCAQDQVTFFTSFGPSKHQQSLTILMSRSQTVHPRSIWILPQSRTNVGKIPLKATKILETARFQLLRWIDGHEAMIL